MATARAPPVPRLWTARCRIQQLLQPRANPVTSTELASPVSPRFIRVSRGKRWRRGSAGNDPPLVSATVRRAVLRRGLRRHLLTQRADVASQNLSLCEVTPVWLDQRSGGMVREADAGEGPYLLVPKLSWRANDSIKFAAFSRAICVASCGLSLAPRSASVVGHTEAIAPICLYCAARWSTPPAYSSLASLPCALDRAVALRPLLSGCRTRRRSSCD